MANLIDKLGQAINGKGLQKQTVDEMLDEFHKQAQNFKPGIMSTRVPHHDPSDMITLEKRYNLEIPQPTFTVAGEPVKQTIFPFIKPSVYRFTTGSFYQLTTKKWGEQTPDTTSKNLPTSIQFCNEDYVTAAGVEPGQLLIAMIDYLGQNPTDRKKEAIKHMQFALAYLDQEVLENNKTTNG